GGQPDNFGACVIGLLAAAKVMSFRRLTHPLRRFAQVSPARRALVVEALVLLLASKIALKLVPFNRLAGKMGTFVHPSDPRAAGVMATNRDAAIAVEIAWAVTRAARWAPFKAVCLPQA